MAITTTRNAPMATSSRPASASPEADTIRTSPPNMSSTPMTTSAPRTKAPIRALLSDLGSRRVGNDDDGRAVGHDLGHVAGHLAAVEAHRDDRVGAHERGVLDQAVQRLASGVLEELGVFVDLAPAQGAQAGDQVAREAAAADHEAERLALRFHGAVAG